jgi:hypothetical protein
MVGDEDLVHEEGHHRADGHHDDGRNADGIDAADDVAVGAEAAEIQVDIGILGVVEEDGEVELPHLEIKEQEKIDNGIRLVIETDADSVMLVVNDMVAGVIDGNSIEIRDLDMTRENTVVLVPLKNGCRGSAVNVSLDDERNEEDGAGSYEMDNAAVIPKTPDTCAI